MMVNPTLILSFEKNSPLKCHPAIHICSYHRVVFVHFPGNVKTSVIIKPVNISVFTLCVVIYYVLGEYKDTSSQTTLISHSPSGCKYQ